MTEPQRYAFDTEFAEDGRILRDRTGVRLTLTREEHEEAIAAALEEAEAKWRMASENKLANAAAAIAVQLGDVSAKAGRDVLKLRKEAAELALACANQLARTALAACASEAVEGAVRDAIALLPHDAMIELRCAPDLVDPLRRALAGTANGAPGLTVRGVAEAVSGDWSLVWREGEISFALESAIEEVGNIVRRRLASEDAQPDLFVQSV
jgi:hypothetical protein